MENLLKDFNYTKEIKNAFNLENMIIAINDYPLKNVNFDLVEDVRAHLD
jgi:hypothetical protein